MNIATDAQPNGMVLQANDLYWLDFNTDHLERTPAAGGQSEQLIEIFFGGMMAADSDAVYWADSSDESINRWAIGATSSTVLANLDLFDDADGLLVDNGTVYYAKGFGCTQVFQVQSDGSSKALLAQGFNEVGLIGVDATHLYLSATDGVYRVDR
jgi:hypothetical protein